MLCDIAHVKKDADTVCEDATGWLRLLLLVFLMLGIAFRQKTSNTDPSGLHWSSSGWPLDTMECGLIRFGASFDA